MNWILRCCVCCSASVTEFSCYIASCVTFSAHVWGMWSCDIWTRFSYIIPIRNLMGEGEQGDNLRHQTKRILQNLSNVRKQNNKFENFWAIWISTRHVGNISLAKTLTKRFFLTTKKRTQSAHILQQCLEHCPLSTTNRRFFIRIICTTNYLRLFSQRGPRYQKNGLF